MRLIVPTVLLVVGAVIPQIGSATPQSVDHGAVSRGFVADNKMPMHLNRIDEGRADVGAPVVGGGTNHVTDSTSVPEPAAMSLLGAALVMLGFARRRSANRAS
jgi:hypothetical protein